jgi:hypothetical protein
LNTSEASSSGSPSATVPALVTKARILEMLRELKANHPRGARVWRPTHWFRCPTGYLPLRVDDTHISIFWNAVLAHGETYVVHVQQYSIPPHVERSRFLDEKVKLVGGNFPW